MSTDLIGGYEMVLAKVLLPTGLVDFKLDAAIANKLRRGHDGVFRWEVPGKHQLDDENHVTPGVAQRIIFKVRSGNVTALALLIKMRSKSAEDGASTLAIVLKN